MPSPIPLGRDKGQGRTFRVRIPDQSGDASMPARILIVDDEAKSEVNVISPTCASTIGIAIEQANSQTAGLLRRKTLEYLLPYVVRNSYAVIRNLQHVATPSLRQSNRDPSLYIERILLDCFEIDGNVSSIQLALVPSAPRKEEMLSTASPYASSGRWRNLGAETLDISRSFCRDPQLGNKMRGGEMPPLNACLTMPPSLRS